MAQRIKIRKCRAVAVAPLGAVARQCTGWTGETPRFYADFHAPTFEAAIAAADHVIREWEHEQQQRRRS